MDLRSGGWPHGLIGVFDQQVAPGCFSRSQGATLSLSLSLLQGRQVRAAKGTLTLQASVDSLAADALELDHNLPSTQVLRLAGGFDQDRNSGAAPAGQSHSSVDSGGSGARRGSSSNPNFLNLGHLSDPGAWAGPAVGATPTLAPARAW